MLPRLFAACALALLLPLSAEEARPYQLPGCSERIVKSSAGAEYRILISVPEGDAPPGGHSIVYLLDGDDLFPVVTSLLRLQAGTGKASKHNAIVPGIVVGIGYPGASRRDLDYTPPSPPGPPETYLDGRPYPPRPGGGADKFFDFIEKDLKPLIEKEHPIDRTRQTLAGNGYGGLFALHVLFTRPASFQTYIAASPSIWWNDRYILNEEKTFAGKLADSPVKARLLLTVGGQEQSLTRIEASWPEEEREEHRLKVTRRKMVDNARELFWRLEKHSSPDFQVLLQIFEGESHKSVVPLSLNHALPFIFPPP